jgi:hypothetical protein
MKTGLIISATLFVLGIAVQAIEVNTLPNVTVSNWAYLYVPLYISGLGFMPLYATFNKIKNKFKK